MSKFVIWVIEDIPESRHEIENFLEQHFDENKIDLITFVDLKAACDLFDDKPKPHLVCADLYYRRPGRLHLTPKDIYSEFIGKGRFAGQGRIDLIKRLAEKCGKECPLVLITTTYTEWFSAHPLVNKRNARDWEDQITSRLNKLPFVRAIISKPRWYEEKVKLLNIVRQAVSENE